MENPGKSRRKRNLSWHQKKMRAAAIVIVVIALILFAGLFYLLNRLAAGPGP